MTTDTKLLPLPELPVAVERFILSSLGPTKREGAITALRTMLREYARANVAHATAPLQAEIEALRVDVEEWKEVHFMLSNTCHHFHARAVIAEARAEPQPVAWQLQDREGNWRDFSAPVWAEHCPKCNLTVSGLVKCVNCGAIAQQPRKGRDTR